MCSATRALPQLIQQAGLKYFMTIKIGWSQYNRLPFLILSCGGALITQYSHFSTVKFGSALLPQLDGKCKRSTHGATSAKELHKDLMAYSYGDGGGGPADA
jgi:alpha-mannosidase